MARFKQFQSESTSQESLKTILELKLDIQDKTQIKCEETVPNAAIMVHLKQNVELMRISERVQTQYMNLWVTVAFV